MTTAPADADLDRLFDAIRLTAAALNMPRPTITRTADGTLLLTPANVDQLVAFASWWHWPFASNAQNGAHVMQAFGQLAGQSCRLYATEPLAPAEA